MRIFSLVLACSCLAVLAAPNAGAFPIGHGAGAIARAVGDCSNPCTVVSNRGGVIVDFKAAGDAIRAGARQKLVIDGYCASACMVMADRARPRACITHNAVFAYHKTNFNRPIPLNGDLRGWINRHGGFPAFHGTPGIMPSQVAARYWPTCS
jgi:hypothetical protein